MTPADPVVRREPESASRSMVRLVARAARPAVRVPAPGEYAGRVPGGIDAADPGPGQPPAAGAAPASNRGHTDTRPRRTTPAIEEVVTGPGPAARPARLTGPTPSADAPARGPRPVMVSAPATPDPTGRGGRADPIPVESALPQQPGPTDGVTREPAAPDGEAAAAAEPDGDATTRAPAVPAAPADVAAPVRDRTPPGSDRPVGRGAREPVERAVPPVQIGRIEVLVAPPEQAADPFAGCRALEGGVTARRGGGW